MKISLYEESAITAKRSSTPTSLSVLITTSITLSLVALTMPSIQEISAAECTSNNDDDTNTNNKNNNNNNNNDDGTTACANQKQQQHSKNQDPSSASNTKSSIPLRLPMPFP
jgi:hypothetical protein